MPVHIHTTQLAPAAARPTTRLTTPEDEARMLAQLRHATRDTAAARRTERDSDAAVPAARATLALPRAAASRPRRALPGENVPKPLSARPRQVRARRVIVMMAATATTRARTAMRRRCVVMADGSLRSSYCYSHHHRDERHDASRVDDSGRPRTHALPRCDDNTWRKTKTRVPPRDGVPTIVLTEPEGQSWFLVRNTACDADEEAGGKVIVDGGGCSEKN
ncbi:hypothetical protein VTH06DRAFT_2692 [Thermothelomyces fergusii]